MVHKSSFVQFIFKFSAIVLVVLNYQMAMGNVCESVDYQGTTLKLLKEQTIADSFVDKSTFNDAAKIPNRFEASDVVISPDGHIMYVVFDNSYKIGAMCTTLGRSFNCTDQLLDWPDTTVGKKSSGFEGMAYNQFSGNYYVVQEAVATSVKKVFRANVFEVRISPTVSSPIRIMESCMANWDFVSDNKGFEGLEFVQHQTSGENFLLGLCEANKCDPKSGSDNDGRVVVMKKKAATTKNPCSWEPVGTFDLPASVYFKDYSAISIYRQESGALPTYVAVTSQENSQVWIGVIEEISEAPFFQVSKLHKETIYNLPRTTEAASNCQIKYCNIEGVAWRGKNQLVLVSDKAKSDQDIHCIEKDQSIHFLVLPGHLTD